MAMYKRPWHVMAEVKFIVLDVNSLWTSRDRSVHIVERARLVLGE